MSFVIFTSSIAPASIVNRYKVHNLLCQKNSSPNPSFPIVHYKCSRVSMVGICTIFRNNSCNIRNFISRDSMDPNNQKFTDVSFDWGDQEEEDPEDMVSPWDGAIIYRRNPSISHIEYCTTLERLGLQKLSTEISKSKASVSGLRVTKAVKDYPLGTPVQISIDVTRKKRKLRLDGIIKTVITLGCNRYFIFLYFLLCSYLVLLYIVKPDGC